MIAHEFVSISLQSIDKLHVQLAVFPFFADERPLRSAAGLADWRLGGAISRRLIEGHLDGTFGEKGMLVSPSKLRVEGVLLFGLGPSDAFHDEVAAQASFSIADALEDAGVTTAALELPGRSLARLRSARAMELWLAAVPRCSSVEEVTVLEAQEDHRALASLVDGLRRHAESPLP